MFRDECELEVQAGRGGDGLMSFRREKYAPKGGPDGGDGGHGGDVVLLATTDINSLLAIGRRPIYKAKNGVPGGPSNKHGARGVDLVLQVPVGTRILDRDRGHLLRDLSSADERLVLAKGGRGGRGNTSFANAVRQAPRNSELGGDGEHRFVQLELKIFAEVGLVGLPNAGKSTFLSTVSRATPKVADYPFTTLVPEVGVAGVGDYDTLVIADLPGLIEGAAQGAGLGHRFLKHVERCRVLLHLVDVSPEATEEPCAAQGVVAGEIGRYSQELASRPSLVVATKCEGKEAEKRAGELEKSLGRPVWRVSSFTRQGLEQVLEEARKIVRATEDD